LVLEPVPKNLPAQGAWNGQKVVLGTGEILLGPALRGRVTALPITGDPGKWQAAERKSEGVVVVTTTGTTQPGPSEGPLLHRCIAKQEMDPDECRVLG
jgi:hypothetical protein